MSRRHSPATGKRYPLRVVCAVWQVPRSSVYATAPGSGSTAGAKRGPKTAQSDADVVTLIRAVLAASPFHSEGHRKVRVRLRQHGVQAGKARVLRLMRVHGLLAPSRAGHPHGDPAHPGRITTDRPDELWGTDATCFWTARDGWCWFFGAIDHGTDEARGVEGDEAGRSVGRPGTDPPGRAVRVRWVPQGHCARADDSQRLGSAVHRARVRRGVAVAGDSALPVVRRRAAMQRGDRALHADAEGAMPVAAPLRRSRARRARDRRLHRALQPANGSSSATAIARRGRSERRCAGPRD